MKTINTTIASALASLTIAGVVGIADKLVKDAQETKTRNRKGYEEVHTSEMMCTGIKPGQFCIANNDLLVGFLPKDMKRDVVSSSFVIEESIKYESDLTPGWYYLKAINSYQMAFYTGEKILIVSSAKRYAIATMSIDIETIAIKGKLDDLKKQVATLSDSVEAKCTASNARSAKKKSVDETGEVPTKID